MPLPRYLSAVQTMWMRNLNEKDATDLATWLDWPTSVEEERDRWGETDDAVAGQQAMMNLVGGA